MRLLARTFAILVAGVLGVGVGVLGAFVHNTSVRAAGVSLSVGVVPALAGLAALLFLTGTVLRSRLPLLAPSVGWAVGVFPLAVPRPEGDLVVAGTIGGYVFLLGGALLVGMLMTLPYGESSPRGRPPLR